MIVATDTSSVPDLLVLSYLGKHMDVVPELLVIHVLLSSSMLVERCLSSVFHLVREKESKSSACSCFAFESGRAESSSLFKNA